MSCSHRGVIHVAGIIDAEEARLLIECGVEFLGFPLVLGHHEEDLSEEAAAAIVDELRDEATFFLITYLDDADRIVALCRRLGVSTAQLHGPIALEEVQKLRASRPSLRIIKSLIVRKDDAAGLLDEIDRFAPFVDAFITDTCDPQTGAIGATGKTHDWDVSRKLALKSPKPLILAGGLHPDNVAEAIQKVRPTGVDVHTGVEGPDGRKDRAKVERFLREARRGFAQIAGAVTSA
ncbi:MAG: N-(5'-phosphoribosyl)anthranilate isomerase [Myxococcales bacterium SG8_38]|nr:MAG: N-(5'-phosphoribosyl)anthranilate isomerase [Myxococcales bacterium SG8_38]